ncbi:MAG: hypothetical protein US68_C0009G0025 [Candidatus Shapirobacteria bacterium GW2011_GWE1_38_10]|uniref:Uncharacterized protein n=1 Tax=Candidatus Shapirobacteria bacterium GW2011_GWE1_38_10 TaxID=1618488 RepID=A0A0G0IGC0_9BACT|nr:MAG: hypothetical protein US46_C0002G0043 [Candidatus Shapirobacteria bacterium GW2011_GWF2_37_20]KKQ50070.1 MAG: hypothetical protein US68_C0009G0025 [Candidatus Shapirobacteria bacterium GW2011_GWE1_38_10]KKQ65282.1 MAG: hypothetical protein US85_C0001G0209 [Candidatus Shapirobacteria bacterium GW2011_GWF1_38_23]HBP51142.1 hypothetical protein [Candidatus Shapirobacteria bacterium]
MLKKLLPIIVVVVNAVFLTYLLIPTPTLKPLPNSVKSTEPGDTVQLKNVSAYYTNLSRTEIMNFYRSSYTNPLVIRLNYPPELSKIIFRDTIQSYYLEELSIPFKESLYINGFEWENDVFTKPEKRIKNKLLFEGIEYRAKITLKTIPTSIPVRLLSFFGTEIALIGVSYLYLKFLKNRGR